MNGREEEKKQGKKKGKIKIWRRKGEKQSIKKMYKP
jgi:hypothetical protein